MDHLVPQRNLGTVLNDPLTDVCIWDISIFVLSFYTAKVQN